LEDCADDWAQVGHFVQLFRTNSLKIYTFIMLFTTTKQEHPYFVFGFKIQSILQYDVLNLIIVANGI